MSISANECCLLNRGNGAWAFEPLATQLSTTLGIDVSEHPRRFNYLLHVEDINQLANLATFIPISAVTMASDKRLIAEAFLAHDVPAPATALLPTFDEVVRFVEANQGEWCLKFPTSCGANGHRLITKFSPEPPNWPPPFVVQEFIRLPRPEVYRTYCAGGESFGWVVRRFPKGSEPSPWVAHARGARYVALGEPPPEALDAARRALIATGLWNSFGCADLLFRPNGQWVVLEVGTDGLFNHVDRDIGDFEFEQQIGRYIGKAFWKAAGDQPSPQQPFRIPLDVA